ncbi:hypothetical protein HUJ04_011353 [Dendroctonus ponderosae]|nr:hypothetical protein HUJ04_011353 [Dendroctonus ponderosae]
MAKTGQLLRVERTDDGSHPIFGPYAEKLESTGKLDDVYIADIARNCILGSDWVAFELPYQQHQDHHLLVRVLLPMHSPN